jgi:histidine triad (HIT) family protein
MLPCIFCNITQHKMSADILYEDDEVMVIRDINPQAPVHILTIPKIHIAKISDIEEKNQQLIGKMIFTAKQVAEEQGISETGFRMVFNNGRHGGQDVHHLHLHLLGGRPMRWPPG